MHVVAGDILIVATFVKGEDMVVEEMTCNGFRSYGICLTGNDNRRRTFPFYSAADWYACGYQSDGHCLMNSSAGKRFRIKLTYFKKSWTA